MNAEDFLLKRDDDVIPWRLFTPDNSNYEYCVLWLQGWTSSMDSHREGVERMSKKSDIAFATLDFAGHGMHKLPIEESSRKLQIDEVVAVYDELKNRNYEKVIVIGGSFGGYLAALLTGIRPIHTAVLRAPAIYADDELETVHKMTRKWINPTSDQQDKANEKYITDNLAVRSISNFDGFVYVLEHELDEQVPRIMPRTYFERAKYGNYIIIPKTKHSPKLMTNPRQHYDYIENFLIAIIEAVKQQDKLDSK